MWYVREHKGLTLKCHKVPLVATMFFTYNDVFEHDEVWILKWPLNQICWMKNFQSKDVSLVIFKYISNEFYIVKYGHICSVPKWCLTSKGPKSPRGTFWVWVRYHVLNSRNYFLRFCFYQKRSNVPKFSRHTLRQL